MKFRLLLVALFYSFFCSAQDNGWVLSPKDTDKVEIDIRALFRGQNLVPGRPFVSPYGDSLLIDGFRWYISNISFIGARSVTLTNCHLYDIADTNSWSFVVAGVPPGVYTHISFVVGVDSIANTSGANQGDLDPAKGMYWAWNSGYIMAKLEGRSPVCKTLHHAFEFHIGGYAPPYNAARTVTLKIPEEFRVGRPSLPGLTIAADAAAWLEGVNLAVTNSIVIPGKDACLAADRYAHMFLVEDVSYTSLNR